MPTALPEKEFLQQPGQQGDTHAAYGVILLAAGFSRRFGGIKLNALLPNGKTVFAQTLARIRAATPNILIVTRPELEALLIENGANKTNTILCPDAEGGMGHTLACGIRHIQATTHWQGALVCLADMPFIATTTYTTLLNALHKDSILVPEHNGQRGNPVGFGAQWFSQLAQASGDSGGRELMKAHPEAITRVNVDDPNIHFDVDVPGDLQQNAAL